jgi:2-keto-4-pentenoate hydratase/2-oxohepta-3-ene-1,7-dioic acid hydratase in catechol pathway
MQLVTYHYKNLIRIGAVQDNLIFDLSDIALDMVQFIKMGIPALDQARAQLNTKKTAVSLDRVKLLAPIPSPLRNIMCLGLNYAEHAAESYSARGQETKLPQTPIVFTKATTTVNGPYHDIPYDPYTSTKIDWEAELAIVIGRPGKNIAPTDAMDHIFGYTVLNDMTARDLQREGKQYFKGKSLDGHCPMGPGVITVDEIPDPHQLAIISRVNGIVKQQSNTRHMIFNIPAIIAYLSRGMTLMPGDIIATGTPSGVGFARTPPEFLRPGDIIECEVEKIGLIRNRVAEASSNH